MLDANTMQFELDKTNANNKILQQRVEELKEACFQLSMENSAMDHSFIERTRKKNKNSAQYEKIKIWRNAKSRYYNTMKSNEKAFNSFKEKIHFLGWTENWHTYKLISDKEFEKLEQKDKEQWMMDQELNTSEEEGKELSKSKNEDDN